MKRTVAVILALIALLGLTARAEANAGIVDLSDLAISYVEAGDARSVRFESAALRIAVGASNGVPTIQGTFDNGQGQVVDGVMQIIGREMQFSVGGISGTYAIDMEAVAAEGSTGEDVAKGLGDMLTLAGSHLDVVLYAVTREEADGMRAVELPLPVPRLIGAARGLLADVDGAPDENLDGLRQSVEGIGEDARLRFRYSPATGAFELAAIQGGRGMQLAGTMAMTFEPTVFADISAEEEKYDLLNLSAETLEQLQGELDMVLTKFSHFADGAGLDDIMP